LLIAGSYAIIAVMEIKNSKILFRVFWILLAAAAVMYWRITMFIAVICAGIWVLGEIIPFIKPHYIEPEDPFYD